MHLEMGLKLWSDYVYISPPPKIVKCKKTYSKEGKANQITHFKASLKENTKDKRK